MTSETEERRSMSDMPDDVYYDLVDSARHESCGRCAYGGDGVCDWCEWCDQRLEKLVEEWTDGNR